jgi:hypothetical protein
MADDEKETARKKAFYTKQRQDAEKAAKTYQGADEEKGAETAARIYSKLGDKKKSESYAKLGALNKVGSVVGKNLDVSKKVAAGASTIAALGGIPGAIRGAAGAAEGLIPAARQGAAKLLQRYGGRAAAGVASAAKSPQAEVKVAQTAEKIAGKTAKSASNTVKKLSPAGRGARAASTSSTPIKATRVVSKTRGVAEKPKMSIEKGSPLERLKVRQAGKTKISQKASEGKRKDNYVRSKAGPENKRAVKGG